MLRERKFSRDVVSKEIDNAERYLKNASRCVHEEMYDLAVVAVYTAMFHAARAVLFRDGLKERSHICLMLYIRVKYPKLRGYAKVLDSYRKSRHTMLYGIDPDIIPSDATSGIEVARELLEAVRREVLSKGQND